MEQGSSKKNNIIVLCVVIAVIVAALVAYFVVSGQKGDSNPTVSATMELNTVNIYGAWYKKVGDSTYELRFKDNKELSYKQTAADGTVTAQSDEGTYDIADGKLILTIVAGGQTYSDTCTANVNEKQMSLAVEANGSGLFGGIYDKDGADYSVPDVSDEEPSEVPETTTTAPQTTIAPETTIKALRKLIDDGFPAKNIVLRIDPIIPTEEGLEKAGYVLRLARIHIPDVKRIRISIYDDYHRAREEMCRRGFAPIDDITKWKSEMERRPSPEQANAVAETCLEYAHPDQIFELCAEPELAAAYPDRFTWSGCLSRKDCEIMNIEVPEHIGINGQNRYGCRCLKMKKELLSSKKRCPTNCAYCYWGRN